jgi:hypothetical protein
MFDSLHGQGIFLFATASIPTLEPTAGLSTSMKLITHL